MNISSVSFGAKPINDVVIKKYNKSTGVYEDYPAKFVKIESGKKADIVAIDKAAKNWKGAFYIGKIATAAHWLDSLPIEIYALTTQQDKFNKLKSSKILGFAEMRKDSNFPDYDWLYYLQVKPKAINISGQDNKTYQHTGTSMIKSLKKIYKNISLFSADSPYLEEYYKRNGFIEDLEYTRHYLWSSNIFKRLKLRIKKFILQLGI